MCMERFRDRLWRQLGYLARSCDSVDQGSLDEAIRIAAVIRILIHQTGTSTSLLTYLNATDMHLLTTCSHMPALEDVLVGFGLGAMDNAKYFATLERAPCRRMVPVGEWWNEVVYVLGMGIRLTRRDIVLDAANKDGGAHVDRNLTPEYEKLTSFLQIGSWAGNGEREWRDANMHFAALRQMGYELLNSPELLMQAEMPSPSVGQQVECQAIQKFGFLMSGRIRQLVSKVNRLNPDRPLICKVMDDTGLFPRATASGYVVAPGEREEIHIDPDRATEYTIAQDIMHARLFRLGWPIVYPVLPPGKDHDADLIAGGVSHCFHQYAFDPALIDLGFDVDGYRDQMTRAIIAWPDTGVTGRDLFRASLKVLEVMLWDGPYRQRTAEAMSAKQPEVLELARELEKKVLTASPRTNLEMRTAMVRFLDYLDDWVTDQTGHPFELGKRIVVSPVLTQDQLAQRARAITDFLSYPLCLNNISFWIVGLAMGSDGILFGRMLLEPVPAGTEPEAVSEARSLWESCDLRGLLEARGIRFGVAT